MRSFAQRGTRAVSMGCVAGAGLFRVLDGVLSQLSLVGGFGPTERFCWKGVLHWSLQACHAYIVYKQLLTATTRTDACMHACVARERP
jgi:hypothetical protein